MTASKWVPPPINEAVDTMPNQRQVGQFTCSEGERPALVVGLGEILWDVLPAGKQLGGAPANFAWHATQLGANGVPVSCVGNDDLGREIPEKLRTMGLDCAYIECVDAETGTVSVRLDDGGTPQYVIHEDVAWDCLKFTPLLSQLARECDAVCIGTLAQRSAVSRRAIMDFLAATRSDCLRVVDVNLRQRYYTREVIETTLSKCHVLKLSDGELPVLARMLGLSGAADLESSPPGLSTRAHDESSGVLPNGWQAPVVQRLLMELRERFDLRLVALTCGAFGSALVSLDATSWRPALPVSVVDTIGAGDAFTAALTVGLLQQRPMVEIHEKATKVAGYVCSCAGAMPSLPRTAGAVAAGAGQPIRA